MPSLSKYLLLPAAFAALTLMLSACGQSGPLRPAEPESAAEEAVSEESVSEVEAADQGDEIP